MHWCLMRAVAVLQTHLCSMLVCLCKHYKVIENNKDTSLQDYAGSAISMGENLKVVWVKFSTLS